MFGLLPPVWLCVSTSALCAFLRTWHDSEGVLVPAAVHAADAARDAAVCVYAPTPCLMLPVESNPVVPLLVSLSFVQDIVLTTYVIWERESSGDDRSFLKR